MKAQEVMGNVDEHGQLSLDAPLVVDKHSRVWIIVLFLEDTEEDDEPKESVLESLNKSLMEAKAGKTKPVSQLWDDIDAE